MRIEARIFRGDGLLSANIPEPDPLLINDENFAVFTSPSMIEVIAQTGIGKSLFCLGLGIALATGGPFLMWRAPKKRRVLIIDGEMISPIIQSRLRSMVKTNNLTTDDLKYLAFMARDWQEKTFLPRLDTDEGQRMMKPFLGSEWTAKDTTEEEEVLAHAKEIGEPEYLKAYNPDVIIFDNAVSLFDPEAELDAKAWMRGQEFLLKLRTNGITSILVHHAGREGEHGRGHSSRDDMMDVICRLKRPPKYDQKKGCRFMFEFIKGRSLFGEAANKFVASYGDKGWSYTFAGEEKVKDAKIAKAVDAWGKLVKETGAKPGDDLVRPKEDDGRPRYDALDNKIVRYIRANPGCATTRVCTRVIGASEGDLKARLYRLKGLGVITVTDQGRWDISE